MYMCIYVYIYTRTCVYIPVHVSIHMYMCIDTCTCVYIPVHVYIHMYMCIDTCTCTCPLILPMNRQTHRQTHIQYKPSFPF